MIMIMIIIVVAVHQNPSDTDSPPNTETHQLITHSYSFLHTQQLKLNFETFLCHTTQEIQSETKRLFLHFIQPSLKVSSLHLWQCRPGHWTQCTQRNNMFLMGKWKRAEYRESLFTLSASRGSCRPSGVHQSVCKLTLKPVTPEFINSFLNRLISVLVQFKVSKLYRQTADTLLVCTCQSQRLF